MKQLCINIDWFEVFCYEPADFGRPSDYEQMGFRVAIRDYGTRVFKQMFTVIAGGNPWIEVRREPKSVASEGGIMNDGACSIRLVNRSCYEPEAVKTLYTFLASVGYNYKKKTVCAISRVDLCLDFRTFADDYKPEVFLKEYLGGKYAKINQTKLQAWGQDFFSDKYFHALKWGSPSSMVSTKVYDKTKEMAEEKTKPWIIDSWVQSGLLSSYADESTVWRLEFSINADCKFWITDQNKFDEYYQNNDIEIWVNPDNYMRIIAGLVSHYFRFVEVQEGKNKYKCPVVKLFNFDYCERYLPKPLRNLMESGRGERAVINKLRKVAASGMVTDRSVDVLEDAVKIFEEIYAYRKQFGTRGIEQYMQNTTKFNDCQRFADLLLDLQEDTSLDLDLRLAVSQLRENYWDYMRKKILT